MTDKALRVLILGAASGIAEATARLYAAEGAHILLGGRNEIRLSQIAADLKLRGAANVEVLLVDFETADIATTLDAMTGAIGGIDHAVLAYGLLGNQGEAEVDLAQAARVLAVNFTSQALWSLAIAGRLERQGSGSLVVLGSVAGDRGRRSNYVYGAAKSGISTLVQGIAHRFAGKGPRAVVVKPGPTDTAMTADLKSRGARLASPDEVARLVRRAADRGGPVQYAPGKWRLIMRVIREIPAPIFNKLNI